METTVLAGKKIVIVDDYQINVELLSLIAEGTGATVLCAYNGRECVDIVCQQPVDLILMDKHMPVMDGLEATRAIRLLPHGKEIVIIGVTGSSDTLEVDACTGAGMNMVFEKTDLNEQKLLEIGECYFGNNGNNQVAASEVKASMLHNPMNAGVNADASSVMDFDMALREFDSDRDLLCSLMVEFSRICGEKCTGMARAVSTGDYLYIQTESHGIKGGAANLCALPLSNAAGALERASRQHAEIAMVASLLNELTGCCRSFDLFVQSVCSSPA